MTPNKLIRLMFLLSIGLLAACGSTDDSWQRVQQSGTLRVGVDPTYPPFATADANGLYGLDVDLANALAEELGLRVQFSLFGYDGLYDALQTGQVDVLISALVVMPERTKEFAYSDPYFNAGEILIVPAAETEINEMADLNGRTLAVELGSLGHVEATTWAKQLPDLTVVPYPTAADALTAVADNLAHAALTDAISGKLFLQTNPALKQTTNPVTVEPYALVVRKEDEQLLTQLNQALQQLQANGRYDQIMQTWLGQ
jgi:polar amino acid transport system substrate-binding protein